ncbi:hypothetical protein [Rheinheimera salexigens]|uniref:Uncharacterized protein n=1 Tax=Rheinheimera salexigens TaxID=1628148 RepID=A0A1E7Q283_9GAMM|nr:hypothetical protein [Rheinheimera salexigens]OEY68226.1 hypothetical protein BI198_00585 [Rheinheimera salexigens]
MHRERRHINKDIRTFWDDLNLAQKFAVSELQRFGYDLFCVRRMESGNLALLIADGHLAAIDRDGEINTAPNVKVRF